MAHSENGLQIDLDQLREQMEQAELIVIGFPTFPERLLLDARSSPSEGPLVAVVAPVSSVQERYAWLGKHRSSFGMPDDFIFAMWPHSIALIRDHDVLEPMGARMAAVSNEADLAMSRAVARLEVLERRAIREAVLGGGAWETLWPEED
ncbi:MAG: hypothetical protein CL897_00695 [Dehalococcoidia bacterium]|nr:hypothetical protein [Dehalococcoidia bacterium]HCV00058.1 hypothetical protein [Dehalococcoidia bacterium]|tara:strand:- start:3097 stop:3543 length:447 start_codon:yes stop_codon:yes gene_type:complete